MGLTRSTFYAEPQVQPIDEARLVEQIKGVCAELRLRARDRRAAWRRPYREPQEGHAADEGKRPDRAAAAAVHMRVWRLPPCEPPSPRAGRHEGASITPIAVCSTR